MKITIKRFISIAEQTEEFITRERILNEIKDLVSTLAMTYNCPSNWRYIGEELAEEYKNNHDIYEALQLWEYETDQ